jgi:hypothetical protein
MATDFIFIDETGDPGALGGSKHFGMALLHVQADSYEAVRRLLATIRWSMSLFTEIKAGPSRRSAQRILEGLEVLAEEGLVRATGLCLTKERYGGRYLSWCEAPIPPAQWALFLRHYLLRHLLEYHFSYGTVPAQIDLVLDRVSLSEAQRLNLLQYLAGSRTRPLRIPRIEQLTVADSKYVGGLQIAHVLAEVVREVADGSAQATEAASGFISLASFIGPGQLLAEK